MTTTGTFLLSDFLSARFAEDEAIAVAAMNTGVSKYGDRYRDEVQFEDGGMNADDGWVVLDPARLLAEIEAKRRIEDLHEATIMYGGPPACGACTLMYPTGANPWPCETLRLLALPYADHPDYQTWRVWGNE